MQRHDQRVIQTQLMSGGEVELGVYAVAKQSLGQRNMPADRVSRHRTPGFLRSLGFLRHADAKRRQVIVEKIHEMIAVHFDDQIRFGLIHAAANLLHERFSSHFS